MSLAPKLLLLLTVGWTAACASTHQVHALATSGCIIEPRPKPGGTPGSGPPGGGGIISAQCGTHHSEHYALIDQAYTDYSHQTVSFEFSLLSCDRVLVGPDRMLDDGDHFVLSGKGEYRLLVALSGNEIRVTAFACDAPLATVACADYLSWPVSGTYLPEPMGIAELTRLHPIRPRDCQREMPAIAMNFRAFGIGTGLTLLSEDIRLVPVWQTKEGTPGLIVRVRPAPSQYGQHSEKMVATPHYDVLEYQVTKIDQKGYSIDFEFTLKEGEAAFVAPLDDLDGLTGRLVKILEGTTKLTLEHNPRWALQNQTVLRLRTSDGTEKAIRTANVGLRQTGGRLTPVLKHLGSKSTKELGVTVTYKGVEVQELAVVAVEIDGVGTQTGFYLIGIQFDLEPTVRSQAPSSTIPPKPRVP